MRALGLRPRCGHREIVGDTGFFWLCHDTNLSNPATRRRFPSDLDCLRSRIGEAWGDTDEQLAALRERLGLPERSGQLHPCAAVHVTSSSAPTLDPPSTVECEAAELPPVAAVIKATALDVPFLGITLPHMLEQAKHPFCERVLVLDRRRRFEGKYARRTGGTVEELDALARELEISRIIDRVVTIEELLPRRDEVLVRYFGDDAGKISPLATTGGPILATLLGLEDVNTDFVVQFDADMLFHAAGPSWVAAGLRTLAADPNIWLVMTHAGPPAGAKGHPSSLGSLNARRARWDPELHVWRFASASTRYFLTDRRRLHGQLRFVANGRGCAPLELCIGAALRRHGASRATLALDGSWDLHPATHEAPFPAWIGDIAAAVVRGEVPSRQRGQYDLRLDRAADRLAWAALLGRPRELSTRRAVRSTPVVARAAPHACRHAARRLPDAGVSPCSAATPAPIAIIIPVRDRAGSRMRRCLASLASQSSGAAAQVLVVSHGSQPEIDDELRDLCPRWGARLIAIGCPSEPWRKPLALNVGLRATSPAVPFVMTLDADMILAPDFLEIVLDTLRSDAPCFVLCRSSDLPQDARVPDEDPVPAAAFEALRRRARLRGRHGTGGIQAAAREFFFDVRGYDEDLVWWGAEDGDMVGRAALAGLERIWICDRTAMLHQWHAKTFTALTDPVARTEAKRAWQRNHAIVRERVDQLLRNPTGWGIASPLVDDPPVGCDPAGEPTSATPICVSSAADDAKGRLLPEP
jgi:hypothetical protein